MIGAASISELPISSLQDAGESAQALAELYGGNIFTARVKKKTPLPEDPDPIIEPLVWEDEIEDEDIPLPEWMQEDAEEEDEQARIRRKLMLRTWYWYNTPR